MSEKISIIIPGVPVAKGRARSVPIPKQGGGYVTDSNGRPVLNHYTPKKTVDWEKFARHEAGMIMQGREPFDGPLRIHVTAVFPIPTSWPSWKVAAANLNMVGHVSKPDVDNVLKAAKDALNGIVWIDDSQIISSPPEKYFGTPCVVIDVWRAGMIPSNLKKKPTIEQLVGWGLNDEQIRQLVAANVVSMPKGKQEPVAQAAMELEA